MKPRVLQEPETGEAAQDAEADLTRTLETVSKILFSFDISLVPSADKA